MTKRKPPPKPVCTECGGDGEFTPMAGMMHDLPCEHCGGTGVEPDPT